MCIFPEELNVAFFLTKFNYSEPFGIHNITIIYYVLLLYILYYIIVYYSTGLPLWSRAESSWLQIHRSAFDSLPYQIFGDVMGLERGPLCLMSTIEELLERKSSGSGLESREYGRRDSSRGPRGTLYPQT
jgi:hypothetical protein